MEKSLAMLFLIGTIVFMDGSHLASKKKMFLCFILVLGLQVNLAAAVRASTWDYCGCSFKDWEGWEECNSDCFGRRFRIRRVQHNRNSGCDGYTDCTSDSDGYDYEDCNNVCRNGGTAASYYPSYPCSCKAGYHGKCCTEVVNCGTPDDIVNGGRSVTSTNYGGVARYYCNSLYKMASGDSVRTCRHSFTWSGTTPKCVFAYHCNSSPCINGNCVNLLGDFRCDCYNGWGGRLCEKDIQPPIAINCSSNIAVKATERTVRFDWIPPSFYDPFGNDLKIVSNYPSPTFVFPWGDFTAQYVATKPSNGLSTECAFIISVRPTPCEELNVPINGALICNGWRRDYGQFCMMTCQQNYTIGPEDNSYETMYVCGASGSWIAAGPVPDCQIEAESVSEALKYQPAYEAYSFDGSCHNSDVVTSLQNLYLKRIVSNGGFSELCTSYPDECILENVDVKCGATA